MILQLLSASAELTLLEAGVGSGAVAGRILAVVVSFNGGDAPVTLARSLAGQVHEVLIVDNGSTAESVRKLHALDAVSGIVVEWLDDNYGIGHALNVGVARARELECEWLLTFDQDSVIADGTIRAFRDAIVRLPDAVSLIPRIVADGVSEPARDEAELAITSGNLVRVALFDQIGLFDEALFIDSVDFDFALRTRQAGHRIMVVPEAILYHQIGAELGAHRWLARFYLRHSPARRYYSYRNHLILVERFWRRFPLLMIKASAYMAIQAGLVLVLDDHPLTSLRHVARGVWDYARGRTGRLRP